MQNHKILSQKELNSYKDNFKDDDLVLCYGVYSATTNEPNICEKMGLCYAQGAVVQQNISFCNNAKKQEIIDDCKDWYNI